MTTTTHDITLDVDGEQIPVELTEPGPITKTQLTSQAPVLPPEVLSQLPGGMTRYISFMVQLVGEVSDFPPELLDDLDDDTFIELTESCANVLVGNDPDDELPSGDEPRGTASNPWSQDNVDQVLSEFDLDDDGSVDPEDWR